MSGLLITFEGTEGGGKSTQIALLADRLRKLGHRARVLREPGGTPIGEEIRHLLKHHPANEVMMPEAELLLMNASRAQLVLEVIRPALTAGEIVLCDRFYDSTTAYQGYGRQLNLDLVRSVIDFAVGRTRPHLTLLLQQEDANGDPTLPWWVLAIYVVWWLTYYFAFEYFWHGQTPGKRAARIRDPKGSRHTRRTGNGALVEFTFNPLPGGRVLAVGHDVTEVKHRDRKSTRLNSSHRT